MRPDGDPIVPSPLGTKCLLEPTHAFVDVIPACRVGQGGALGLRLTTSQQIKGVSLQRANQNSLANKSQQGGEMAECESRVRCRVVMNPALHMLRINQ